MNSPVNGEAIMRSLDLVAEKCGDPAPFVYERLFRQSPEMKPLFLSDTSNLAKGEMLFRVIECFLDYAGPRAYAANLISSELRNHDNLGVPPEVFATFFRTVMETFREIAGGDWTAEFDGAWSEMLQGLDRIVSDQAAAMSAA
ncbi:MAG: globin [Parvibaculum sp.]|uniref:globin domain-containing protein n=1 Tax=Parvibaculum sp. TaxID=2024848 RepID=UPI003C771004